MEKIDMKELDDLFEEIERDCTSRTLVTVSDENEYVQLEFERTERGALVKQPSENHHLVLQARITRMILEKAAGMVVRRFRDEVNPETGRKLQDVAHYFLHERDGRIVVDRHAEFKE